MPRYVDPAFQSSRPSLPAYTVDAHSPEYAQASVEWANIPTPVYDELNNKLKFVDGIPTEESKKIFSEMFWPQVEKLKQTYGPGADVELRDLPTLGGEITLESRMWNFLYAFQTAEKRTQYKSEYGYDNVADRYRYLRYVKENPPSSTPAKGKLRGVPGMTPREMRDKELAGLFSAGIRKRKTKRATKHARMSRRR